MPDDNDTAIIGDKPVAKSHAGTLVPNAPSETHANETVKASANILPASIAQFPPNKKKRQKCHAKKSLGASKSAQAMRKGSKQLSKTLSIAQFRNPKPDPDLEQIAYEELPPEMFEALAEQVRSWNKKDLMIARGLLLERKIAADRVDETKKRFCGQSTISSWNFIIVMRRCSEAY